MGDILRGAHKVKRIGCPHLKKSKTRGDGTAFPSRTDRKNTLFPQNDRQYVVKRNAFHAEKI